MAEQHSLTEDYETTFKFNEGLTLRKCPVGIFSVGASRCEGDEETGNYYYGARYCDPKWSIFISVDPLVDKTMDAYGFYK